MVAANLILLFIPAIIWSCLLHVASQDQQQSNHYLLSQLDEAKLKVAQLESSLVEMIQQIKAKDIYLATQEKQIQDTEEKINHLQLNLSNLKSSSLLIDKKINALEEESKAQEAEDRLQLLHSRFEKMSDIVSEQWIQIQQFEQALQLRQMTILKIQRRFEPPRCSFLKFMNHLSSKYLPDSLRSLVSPSFGNLKSYISQTLDQLQRFYSTMKEFHHELQGLIKKEMERHEFTSPFANEELVFFVASALIIFPVFGAWMLLSSQLR